MKYNTVKNFKQLFALPRKVVGDIIYCEEEKRAYTYTEEKVWEPCTISGEGLSLSLFDLNAQAIEQLPDMDDEALTTISNDIDDFSIESQNTYFMFMCKEQSYYTIIKHSFSKEFHSLSEAVITLARELGAIKSIYKNDTNDFDIWVKVNEDMWCIHLFPYDAGVVYYG